MMHALHKICIAAAVVLAVAAVANFAMQYDRIEFATSTLALWSLGFSAVAGTLQAAKPAKKPRK